MTEIKTIDDLIKYIRNSIFCTHLHIKRCNYTSAADFPTGKCIAYEDMLKKSQELKANMEKQND